MSLFKKSHAVLWLKFALVAVVVLAIIAVVAVSSLYRGQVTKLKAEAAAAKNQVSECEAGANLSLNNRLSSINTNLVEPLRRATAEIGDWKTFQGKHFEISYPETFLFEAATAEEQKTSSTLAKFLVFNADADLAVMGEANPGYYKYLTVDYWPDLASLAKAFKSQSGETNYKNLADLLADQGLGGIKKVADAKLSGQKAYQVTIGAECSNDGLLLEDNGFYLLSFDCSIQNSPAAEIKEKIIKSFKVVE
ncbi:MAG: hypothetical protein WCT37_03100 [Patescibacteria group bacterium]|jgi:hypothetical protein